MTQIEAYKDRVVVERIDVLDERTVGGIVIPKEVSDKANENSKFGKVLSVGSLVKDIKVGEVVVFGKFAGSPVKDFGEDVHILKDADIHGKYTGNV